jgi:hypothetical protein
VEKQTGLGWDNDKQTIMAPDEWWAEKSKVWLLFTIQIQVFYELHVFL